MFAHFRRNKERRARAARLYAAMLTQARQPDFYALHGVPDTFTGRFELLVLHGFLVWSRLAAEGAVGQRMAQDLFDIMFRDLNQAVRNVGIGDLAVPHHIKRMMKGFKGRALNYQESLSEPEMTRDALKRNLFGAVSDPSAVHVDYFVDYMRRAEAHLSRYDSAMILQGAVDFGGLNPLQAREAA